MSNGAVLLYMWELAMAHLQGTVHEVGAGSKTEQTATLKVDLRELESLARLCSPVLPEPLQTVSKAWAQLAKHISHCVTFYIQIIR